MKYRKRYKSSDSNTAAFIRSAALGVLSGALFLCVMLLLFSAVITATENLPGGHAVMIIKFFIMLASASCGYIIAFSYKRKGIIIGGFASFLFAVVFFVYKSINAVCVINKQVFVNVIIIMLCGAIGGVLGVNNNSARKKLYK